MVPVETSETAGTTSGSCGVARRAGCRCTRASRGGSRGRRCGRGRGAIWRGCWTAWTARMAGSWPSTWARPARRGCSACSMRPTGTPTRCATTCAAMWWSTWARRMGCWWSTRPGSSRRGPSRSGSSGSIAAPPAASRTARSGCSWPTRAARAAPSWTGNSICPRSGQRIRRAGRKRGCPPRCGFATKGQLAQTMLARAFAAGVPAAWVTGDEVYGNAGQLRAWLEEQRRAYVLAVSCDHLVWADGRQQRVDALLRRAAGRRLAAALRRGGQPGAAAL